MTETWEYQSTNGQTNGVLQILDRKVIEGEEVYFISITKLHLEAQMNGISFMPFEKAALETSLIEFRNYSKLSIEEQKKLEDNILDWMTAKSGIWNTSVAEAVELTIQTL